MNIEKHSASLSCIEINPTRPATAAIIWLHGLGATNDDFVSVAPELLHLTGLALRFVFPQAPLCPVTVNNGAIMPAWYDLTSFGWDGKIDHEGIAHSVSQIKVLIEKERARGIAADKIILAGFSQGAVIVLSTLLAYPGRLGGIIGLSGYLPVSEKELATGSPATPVFLGHGTADEVVSSVFGQHAYEVLKKAGYPVTWRTYAMAHGVCHEEIVDIGGWLKDAMA